MLNNPAKATVLRKKLIDSSVKRLQIVTGRYEKENKHSFFTGDTVYLVSFVGAETGFTSEIIWNYTSSCYYKHSFKILHSKIINQKLEVKTDASAILKSFPSGFLSSIVRGDTAAYHKYADENKVFDGEWVQPLLAVRTVKGWAFTSFPGNGWAINYDFEPVNHK